MKKPHKRKRRQQIKPRAACLIYGLCDPGTDNIRYIGQTTLTMAKRFGWHLRTIRKNLKIGKRLSPVQSWLYHLDKDGKRPDFKRIDEAGTWDVSEIIWIERYRIAGHPLLNVLRGGNDSYDAVIRDGAHKSVPTYKPIDDLEREYRDIIR